MKPERLTALTDGVIAVILTIMVLEMKPPAGADLASLEQLWPTFLSFVLSFIYVAIYWNNHHHFFTLTRRRHDPLDQLRPPLLPLPHPVRDRLDGRRRPPLLTHRLLRRPPLLLASALSCVLQSRDPPAGRRS